METIYYPDDDILVVKFSDKPIVRERSQDWNINLSYADHSQQFHLITQRFG